MPSKGPWKRRERISQERTNTIHDYGETKGKLELTRNRRLSREGDGREPG